MSDTIAQLHSVKKSFGRTLVLNDINLSIGKGEIVGLLGPNGSGKTTVMKLLSKMLFPDEGNILYADRFHALIEEPRFYSSLSGYNNLLYFAYLSGKGKKEVQTVAEGLRLQKYIHKRVKKYSLGMKQKLGIATALLAESDLLILDEPMNGLDPYAVVEVRALLKKLAKESGTAILLSSHILSEMQKVCDRVLILKEGRILSEHFVTDELDLEKLYISCFKEEI
ncbi:MAG: ABC transporter ATP-binding protein [Eubacteriales bacterium]